MNETATTSDRQLLARFTRDRAEDAFAELVRRHIDLIHSAALRQVRSPQLAEEVAQSVFTDLARNAHRLTGGGDAPSPGSLTPWLYQVTRRTAIDVVRREARRQLREQIATEMNVMNATTADWTHIEPLLDEAMSTLDESDRAAVLLRYFENKSLREVGQQLGTSDDAAQKRVSRAVERLREFFAKRGVTVGAGGLVVVISANAVQAAPVGLAVTISTTAALAGTTLATLAPTASATATKAIAMTTLQKTVIAATVAVLAGVGIYEAHQASQLRDQIQTIQQKQKPLVEQVEQLSRKREEAARQLTTLREVNERLNRNTSELLRLRGEVARLRSDAAERENDSTDGEVAALATKIKQVKRWLEENPQEQIPELEFVRFADWVNQVASHVHWNGSTNNFKFVLGFLRTRGKSAFARYAVVALDDYLIANGGNLPKELSELKPYFAAHADLANRQGYHFPPVTDAMLQRYALTRTGNLGDFPETEMLIVENAPIQDGQYDALFKIGAFGYSYEKVHPYGSGGYGGSPDSRTQQKLRALYER